MPNQLSNIQTKNERNSGQTLTVLWTRGCGDTFSVLGFWSLAGFVSIWIILLEFIYFESFSSVFLKSFFCSDLFKTSRPWPVYFGGAVFWTFAIASCSDWLTNFAPMGFGSGDNDVCWGNWLGFPAKFPLEILDLSSFAPLIVAFPCYDLGESIRRSFSEWALLLSSKLLKPLSSSMILLVVDGAWPPATLLD